MTDQHPITPPPELVQRLSNSPDNWLHQITNAYQAGADQELESCCKWFVRDWTDIETADKLRAARRPKPPSLKEQALGALGRFSSNAHTRADEMTKDFDLLRRALEALDG